MCSNASRTQMAIMLVLHYIRWHPLYLTVSQVVQKLIECVPAEHLSFIPASRAAFLNFQPIPMGVVFSKDVSSTWMKNRLGHSWMNFISTLSTYSRSVWGVLEVYASFLALTVTNLLYGTTLYSMFLNMASSTIERLLYPSFEAKCFICLVTNSCWMSVREGSPHRWPWKLCSVADQPLANHHQSLFFLSPYRLHTLVL